MEDTRAAFEAWLGYCEQLDRHTIESMWSAWKAATAQCVPDGFVVVPKEPTREMLDAYVNQNLKFQSGRSDWRAMLEAAPKPGEQA